MGSFICSQRETTRDDVGSRTHGTVFRQRPLEGTNGREKKRESGIPGIHMRGRDTGNVKADFYEPKRKTTTDRVRKRASGPADVPKGRLLTTVSLIFNFR